MAAVIPIEVAVPLFILGAVVLVKGADLFTDGSLRLARALGISEFMIGITLVALATSLPEFGVSVVAATGGSGEMALGTVLGSNIANIAFVLGFALLMRSLVANWREMREGVIFMLVAGVLVVGVIFDGGIQRWEALAMVGLYIAYLCTLAARGRRSKGVDERGSVPRVVYLFLIVGAIAIYAGAEFVFRGASGIIDFFGVTQTAVGLTIVALSTSLPEATASVVAARKGAVGLSIGNIVGSNLFNILVVLGVAGSVAPFTITQASWNALMWIPIPLMLILSVFLVGLVRMGRIPRKIAPVLLACYAIFVLLAYA